MSPPTTIPEVLARMQAIEASAPASDGVVCFTRLYREVTESVDVGLGGFADEAFLAELDVSFAGLFFAAFDAPPATRPRAWAPLFDSRSRKGIAPLQFAFAGMNAHINRDLPVALVGAWAARNLSPAEGSPQHADFMRVNALLAAVETKIKASYMTGWIARLDRVLHRLDRVDDVVAMWNVVKARDAAWSNGEALWALRGESRLAVEFVSTLDSMVGLAGRGLLVPAESRLRRLAR